jgi:hypothetical protein
MSEHFVPRSFGADLLRRLRERRREILKALSPELLAEYRRLGIAIRTVIIEEGKSTVAKCTNDGKFDALLATVFGHLLTSDEFGQQLKERTPMSAHKKRLIDFLHDARMATRAQILASTGIPEGSLSQLLREPEFEQMERGTWRLKDWPRKPTE